PYSALNFAAIACRSAGTPCIGAYWLRPSRMCRATASTSAGSQSKSGNPCDRLIAPRSAASFDMTVKIVVPTLGSLDASTLVCTAVPILTGDQETRRSGGKPGCPNQQEYLLIS